MTAPQGDALTDPIPPPLIEYILLGSGDSRRQLQDSPILGDVWIEYAKHPDSAIDLLITSDRDATASEVAKAVYEGVKDRPLWRDDDPEIAPLQSFVAARLYFDDLLRIVVPMTKWWHDERTAQQFAQFSTPDFDDPPDSDGPLKLNQSIDDVKGLLDRWSSTAEATLAANQRTAFERFVALCALVFLAREKLQKAQRAAVTSDEAEATPSLAEKRHAVVVEATTQLRASSENQISKAVFDVLKTMEVSPNSKATVFQISLNRRATPALEKSVPTTKADAARLLFNIDCRKINWAIVDSGIDSEHTALKGQVKATYDFTNYRRIVSLGNTKLRVRERNLDKIRHSRNDSLPEDADRKLKEIAKNAVAGRPVRWDLVREFVEVEKPRPPTSPHGTHVAGIIGAHKDDRFDESADGMCPGIGLYDFRILCSDDKGTDEKNTEFAIIAALQFIRHRNEQAGSMLIKGVNMSLSIRHDVRNYACGGTPVCVESERLVDSGVVVVVAAGNLGYQHTMVGGQPFDSYAAFSITDPGNAEKVITVGSTHRFEPFTYGVSYFSSRGPTGDGRLKPDLVAPGERIYAPLPGDRWDYLDGTSMAAPHVSGAAAMLMSRYPELVGKPGRIKQILCSNASDLGRERNFQGHGLVDVLRALQSQ